MEAERRLPWNWNKYFHIICTGTLKKLRGGLLGIHLDGFCAWLMERGFSRHTIRMHLSNGSHFNNHLERQKAVVGYPPQFNPPYLAVVLKETDFACG